jgi:glutamyl-tRNA reductase
LILKPIDSRRMKIGQMALKSAECAVPEINGRHPLIIGGGGIIRSLERYFAGGIAEVRIWNRERADISSDIEVEYVKGTFNATGEVVHMCFCEVQYATI